MMAFEIVPVPKFRMMSSAASAPCPEWIISFHFRPCGSAMIVGSPPTMSGKKPKPSEWSATTRKSSGRESFTGCPLFDVTSSPRANRKASAGPRRAPKAPASIEKEVWRCVSPKKGRVGKFRPA